MRIIVTGAQRAHGGKTTNAQRRHRRLRPTRHHDVGIAVLNHATGFTNAVQTRGAGGHDGNIRTFEAKPNRHVASDHVHDGRRHEKRRNSACATLHVLRVHVFNHRQSADARTDHTTDAGSQLVAQGVACGQTGIDHRLVGCGNTEVDKCVHRARFFGADVRVKVKAFHLACDFAGEARRVELGDEINAGLASQQVRPSVSDRVTHGTDTT